MPFSSSRPFCPDARGRADGRAARPPGAPFLPGRARARLPATVGDASTGGLREAQGVTYAMGLPGIIPAEAGIHIFVIAPDL